MLKVRLLLIFNSQLLLLSIFFKENISKKLLTKKGRTVMIGKKLAEANLFFAALS